VGMTGRASSAACACRQAGGPGGGWRGGNNASFARVQVASATASGRGSASRIQGVRMVSAVAGLV
jgi:hypothetical protein